jgi:two-component system nitrate/nitrite response regulator NarL
VGQYRILLVDDNPVVRNIVRQVLEKDLELMVCGEAGDGAQALEKAEALRPDIVVLDLSMPVMNGLEVAPKIRSLLPGACLILFTLYGSAEVTQAARHAGIDAVISKADRGDELVKAAKSFFSGAKAASRSTSS